MSQHDSGLKSVIVVKWVRQFYRKIRPEVAVTSQTAGNKNSQASFHVNSKFPFSNSWSSSPLVETTAAVKLKLWLLHSWVNKYQIWLSKFIEIKEGSSFKVSFSFKHVSAQNSIQVWILTNKKAVFRYMDWFLLVDMTTKTHI